MKIIICDDEPLARERLLRMLTQLGHDVLAQAANGRQAIDLVKQYQPDVILLDMRMPEMSGLECAALLNQLNMPPAMIFCTAFDQYALDAFKAAACDYLLKPVSMDDLKQALDRSMRINQAQLQHIAYSEVMTGASSCRQHIAARTHRGMELIALDDIYYFLADQKYVMVKHKQGQVLIDETLKELEQEFSERFIRIHRNALLSLKYLDGIELIDGGQYQIRCKEIDDRLLISRRHLSSIKERMHVL
ncbi:response regulator transcription factor [Acinetobacter qingfengensis]|uniref:DNA-binding response regulator n=1 Tax=Acinetobacter qingfengensis TaxID=1262585 RepID=A0A1E7RDC9_9GAMM|nr:LytTR family DNA-binding domain-containing protein [Acinetobacter qingfengensis]KAA8732353.1 response regulator transcription factor [Acinetobacter qingfengensis]OEY97262.1 DNA-binding response regulator [Acinetobacter qingfengensis]